MKPTTKRKLIKAIDIAVQALEIKCGGPGSGVPGPCPIGGGGGGAKPPSKPASKPASDEKLQERKVLKNDEYNDEVGKMRRHPNSQDTLVPHGFSEVKASVPKGVKVSSAKGNFYSASTKQPLSELAEKFTAAGWKHTESLGTEAGRRSDYFEKGGKRAEISGNNPAQEMSTISMYHLTNPSSSLSID